MKKAICLFLTAITLLLSMIAYSQSPDPLYQHLPASANHIYSIRLGQILAKGQLADVLSSIPPSKDPHAAMAFSILQDPASAGIDLGHEILIAQTTATGNGADTVSFIEVLVPLTDSAKFRITLAKALKTGQQIHRLPGKGASTYMGKEGLAWNAQLVVVTEASVESSGAAPSHTATPAAHRSLGELAVEKSVAALAGFPGTPWLTDQRFLTGFATEEDIHAWSTRMDFMQVMSKVIKKMAAKNPAMQGKPLPDYSNMGQMPHPPVLSTFSFENGRIVFRMTMFNKPDDVATYQREFDRPINKDLLARVPGGLLLGFAAMHLNPAAFPDVMDKYHTRRMVDSILGKKGLSVSDISAAFGGDFLVVAMADTTATTDTAKKKVNFYFVATLGDPAKLMQLAAKLGASDGALTDTAQIAKMKKLASKLVIQDNMLVVSGSKEMAQKYFANTDRRSTGLLDEDNSVQSIVIDLKAVSAFVGTSMSNNPKAMIATRILEKLDKIELNTIPDGNNMVTTFQIVTGDPSTNSLKTLVSILH
jgi:hypothetical protein